MPVHGQHGFSVLRFDDVGAVRRSTFIYTTSVAIANTTHYVMSGRTNGPGGTDTTFVNNVIQGGSVVADINGPYSGAVWDDNIIWNTGGVGDMPAGGWHLGRRGLCYGLWFRDSVESTGALSPAPPGGESHGEPQTSPRFANPAMCSPARNASA
jgi:hypothetical protein